jgi:predicted DNA-binding transcriptional regulator AlpA
MAKLTSLPVASAASAHRRPLTVKEAAEYTGFPASRLDKLRCSGGGPLYLKHNRVVRYRPSDLDAWLDSMEQRTTSDVREVA